MFKITEKKNIEITRGDIAVIDVNARNEKNDGYHVFVPEDIVRLQVMEKNNYSSVVLTKEVKVTEETTVVTIELTKEDTKIGNVISKYKDYAYEIELNPETKPRTIIGYTKEDGHKLFTLLPEGGKE